MADPLDPTKLPEPMRREPVAFGGLLVLAVNVVTALLQAFGLYTLTGPQTLAVHGAVGFVSLVVFVVVTRRIVWSPDTIARVPDGALEQALLDKYPPAHGHE